MKSGGTFLSASLPLLNIGTVHEPTGYAKANRHVILELAKKGMAVRFTPHHPETVRVSLSSHEEQLLHRLTHTTLPPHYPVLFHYPAHYFYKLIHQYTIGMTMYECNRLPLTWVKRCSMMNEIWVPSHFNKQTFANSGIPAHKLHVMPYGVDTQMFQPRETSLPISNRRSYAFLAVCSFDERKGIETLITAFCSEFTETEDVCLLLKTRATTNQEILQQQAYIDRIAVQVSGKPRPSILLLSTTGSWSEEQLALLYNSADCYVLPTRGEGWSLTVMEAMASGLPVITTNWSAHLDFIHTDNGYLINVEKFAAPHPQYPRLFWAVPDLLHLRQLMRHVYHHPDEAKARGALGKQSINEHYTWTQSAANMFDRLQQLANHG